MDTWPRPRAAVFIPLPPLPLGIMPSLRLNKASAGNAITLQRAVPAPWFYTEEALVSGDPAHGTPHTLQAPLPPPPGPSSTSTALTAPGLRLRDGRAHPLAQTDAPVQLPLPSSWHRHRKSTKRQVATKNPREISLKQKETGRRRWVPPQGCCRMQNGCGVGSRRAEVEEEWVVFFLKGGGFLPAHHQD